MGWVLALTLAVGLHLSVFWWLARSDDVVTEGAQAPGEAGVVIGLGPAGQPAGQPEPVTESVPEPEPEPEPRPRPEPEPKPEPKPEPTPKPEPKPRPPEPKPRPQPKPEPVAEPTPAPVAQPRAEPQGQSREDSRESASNQPGRQAGQAAGGDPAATQDYLQVVRAWLERHKEYPRQAQLRRQEGVVYVRFVMNRNGEVLSHSIERSSGHTLLDREVTSMLQRAQPLPVMPPELPQHRLEVVLPVAFNLR
ncbi:TonB family protein [Ectothiorhodospira sp. PHS-1]|nr:TonB family protein [Ectothiorhodospira sp. PHS-1]